MRRYILFLLLFSLLLCVVCAKFPSASQNLRFKTIHRRNLRGTERARSRKRYLRRKNALKHRKYLLLPNVYEDKINDIYTKYLNAPSALLDSEDEEDIIEDFEDEEEMDDEEEDVNEVLGADMYGHDIPKTKAYNELGNIITQYEIGAQALDADAQDADLQDEDLEDVNDEEMDTENEDDEGRVQSVCCAIPPLLHQLFVNQKMILNQIARDNQFEHRTRMRTMKLEQEMQNQKALHPKIISAFKNVRGQMDSLYTNTRQLDTMIRHLKRLQTMNHMKSGINSIMKGIETMADRINQRANADKIADSTLLTHLFSQQDVPVVSLVRDD
jgi:hypothetical protein